MGLLAFKQTAWGSRVDAYDKSFSLEIPDTWQLFPSHGFRSPGVAFSADPIPHHLKELRKKQPPGLMVFHVPGQELQGKSLDQAAALKREEILSKKPPQDPPVPSLSTLQIRKGLAPAHLFQTGNQATDYTFIYFSYFGKAFQAVCPNLRQKECRKILASLQPPTGNTQQTLYPKIGKFLVRIPEGWSIVENNPRRLVLVKLPQDSFQIRLPLFPLPSKNPDILEKALRRSFLRLYKKPSEGPGSLETLPLVKDDRNLGQLSFVKGKDPSQGNILVGYFLTEGKTYLLVSLSSNSSPLDNALLILNSWKDEKF